MGVSRAVAALLIVSTPVFTMAQTGGLTCSSDDGGYRYCRADTQNQVQLTRQISGSRCELGYSWGYDPRGIWVDRGCRAQFTYGRGRSDNGSNTGAVIAGGILGALILGAAVAASKSDNDDGGDHERVNYYNDGYRWGGRMPMKASVTSTSGGATATRRSMREISPRDMPMATTTMAAGRLDRHRS